MSGWLKALKYNEFRESMFSYGEIKPRINTNTHEFKNKINVTMNEHKFKNGKAP